MTNTTTPAAETVSYFFLLRIQWQVGGGMAATVLHGTHPVRAGQGRHEVFTELRDMAITRVGAPADADITAFTLEPDRLA